MSKYSTKEVNRVADNYLSRLNQAPEEVKEDLRKQYIDELIDSIWLIIVSSKGGVNWWSIIISLPMLVSNVVALVKLWKNGTDGEAG